MAKKKTTKKKGAKTKGVKKMTKKEMAEAKGGGCMTLGSAYTACRINGRNYSYGGGVGSSSPQSTMVMMYALSNGYNKIVPELATTSLTRTTSTTDFSNSTSLWSGYKLT